MYEVEILPSAMRDMTEAVAYIKDKLFNSAAAAKLAREFFSEISKLLGNPYLHMLYGLRVPATNHECRRMNVLSYSVFYWIEEMSGKVVVARMIYSRRDFPTLLQQL